MISRKGREAEKSYNGDTLIVNVGMFMEFLLKLGVTLAWSVVDRLVAGRQGG